jgi:hypothetical protein
LLLNHEFDSTGEIMKDRLPSEFETKVLKRIDLPDWRRSLAGNKMVAISAACRRLEKLGYAGKGVSWYVTKKGDEYLASIGAVEHSVEPTVESSEVSLREKMDALLEARSK